MHNQMFVSDEQTNGLEIMMRLSTECHLHHGVRNRMSPSPWCEKLNSAMTQFKSSKVQKIFRLSAGVTILNTNKVHLCTLQFLLIAGVTSNTSS